MSVSSLAALRKTKPKISPTSLSPAERMAHALRPRGLAINTPIASRADNDRTRAIAGRSISARSQ